MILSTSIKGDSSYSPTYPSGVVTLSELGTYQMRALVDEGYWEYHFTEYGAVVDTIRMPGICLGFVGHIHSMQWAYYCCEEKCEGKLEDYYFNGNKRIAGNFKEGQALGQVRSYYPNGQLYQRATYFPRGNLQHRITYDPDGEVKSRENVFFYPIFRLISELENLGR